MKKVNKLFTAVLMAAAFGICAPADAEPDPNFHIFLCIGQSNMVGEAPITSQYTRNVPSRFKVMSPVDCDIHPKNQWSVAVPPLCRCDTKLGLVDFFGRTMLQYLPEMDSVGVIVVAVEGTKIDLFHPNKYKAYIDYVKTDNSVAYQRDQINAYHPYHPLQALIETARLAQKDGVISGILLHQGETDAESAGYTWRKNVKEVYQYILKELNLSADSVPLLAGEVVRGDQNRKGQCVGANKVIAKLPSVIPTSYVISSEDCSCQSDYLHFDAAGYSLLGSRYAETYLTEYLGMDLSSVRPPYSDEPSDALIYDTNGYQLQTLQHGINIINGKKYWVE